MKTIYLTNLFLLLVILLCGCNGNDDIAFVASGENGIESSSHNIADNDPDMTGKYDVTENTEHYSKDLAYDKGDIISVYVCGHVACPGVYELEDGSRICDVLELAGGVKEDGVPEALDQATKIVDGQTIYVPGIDEEWSRIDNDSKTSSSDADSSKLNINTATKDEFMTLPGIGESKASDIIRYRDEHGSFKSIEEIMNIQGIKEGVFNKIKDLIQC